MEALIRLRVPTPRLKTKTEKEGEEYIDFYWKFEATKKDEATRTLKMTFALLNKIHFVRKKPKKLVFIARN